MTTDDRPPTVTPERLAQCLADLATTSRPDYRDDLLRRTASTRQRPAWTFIERWLPMALVTTRQSTAPALRIAWLILLMLLFAALLATGLFVIGSQPQRDQGPRLNAVVPPVAVNGTVSGGDCPVDDTLRYVDGITTKRDGYCNPTWTLDDPRFGGVLTWAMNADAYRDGSGLDTQVLGVSMVDEEGAWRMVPEVMYQVAGAEWPTGPLPAQFVMHGEGAYEGFYAVFTFHTYGRGTTGGTLDGFIVQGELPPEPAAALAAAAAPSPVIGDRVPPVAVSGSAAGGECPVLDTVEIVDGVTTKRDGYCTPSWTLDDPRFGGTVTWAMNADAFPDGSGLETQILGVSMIDDTGAWRMVPEVMYQVAGAEWPTGPLPTQFVMHGEGAYEGSYAVFTFEGWNGSSGTLDGFIVQGDLPPEPAATAG